MAKMVSRSVDKPHKSGAIQFTHAAAMQSIAN